MNLPALIKKPNVNYVLAIDTATEGHTEIFTFCVAYKEGKHIVVQQCGSLFNNVQHKVDSKINTYINMLREFYEPVMVMET